MYECPSIRRNSDSSDTSFSMSPSSTTSSESSSSPSPHGLTYANPISIPLKSLLSPPRTSTTIVDYFSLSPATPPSAPFNSPNANSVCAFPSWPSGPLLSSSSSTSTCCATGCAKSSYISDEDLLDLEELELCGDVRVITGYPEISWSMTRQPPLVVEAQSINIVARPKKKRRRSSPLKKQRFVGRMSPIVEDME